MSELGFQPPPQQVQVQPDEYGSIELSAENIGLLDGDLLFLEVREGSTRHTDSPLWARPDRTPSPALSLGDVWSRIRSEPPELGSRAF